MGHTPDDYKHIQRTEDYVYSIPAPPRIVVPPPPACDRIDGQYHVGLSTILPQPVAEAQLRQYDSTTLINWTYEKRQQAQYILPYVLLGPMSITRDAEWLRNEGITLALGVRQGQSKILDAALQRCRSVNIEQHSVSGDQTHSLASLYPATTSLLASHLSRNAQNTGSPGKVLVFCESGNDRSAAVVAAFMMATHDAVDHIKAMQLCQVKRFCCNFNEATKHSLQTYWDILCAQRSSSTVPEGCHELNGQRAMVAQVSSRKRRARDDDDNDDDMDMADDGVPLVGGFSESRLRAAAPFADPPAAYD